MGYSIEVDLAKWVLRTVGEWDWLRITSGILLSQSLTRRVHGVKTINTSVLVNTGTACSYIAESNFCITTFYVIFLVYKESWVSLLATSCIYLVSYSPYPCSVDRRQVRPAGTIITLIQRTFIFDQSQSKVSVLLVGSKIAHFCNLLAKAI